MTTIFDQAAKRAALRSRIAEAVRGFDRAMAGEELAMLAQELAGPGTVGAHEPPRANGHHRPAPRPVRKPSKPANAPPAAKAAADAEKPKNDGPRARQVLALLAAKPRAPIAEIAQEMYGSRSEAAQGKVRNLLLSLKATKQAVNVGLGQWEVAAQ